ncbi:MAG TPA: Gfo/Idh/MocA family oxidoreductase, partial [Phycisphaerae bacterium]|nr:Gfo/Idh/MocA family oxidoreductase [Phycisphaerae bacterium]
MREKINANRRRFLKTAARLAAGAAAFPYVVPSSVLGKDGAVAPSERIVVGSVAVGGRGGSLLGGFLGLRDAQVLAVCDVKRERRYWAEQTVDRRYGKKVCTAYSDFRELCARDDLDAVVVASTDHWHVPLALAAVRAGKDVYCEKPLAVSVEQGQVLREACRRYGAVFQFGTQERSAWSTRLACQIVRNGWIGKVRRVKVGSRYSRVSGTFQPQPVPKTLDYDLWLGPAPWAPYSPQRVANSGWFHISDYALGFLAGCGIHTVDMAQWGNGTELTGPIEVEGSGEFPKDGTCDCATGWDVNLTFANGSVMNFTDGKRNPLGVRFEGTEGWVFVKERHLGGSVNAHPR